MHIDLAPLFGVTDAAARLKALVAVGHEF